MIESAFHQRSDESTLELFRQLSRRHCELVAGEGIRAVPYAHDSLEHFRQLSMESQKQVLHQLSETVAVYEEMATASLSLRDNPQLLWRSMSRIGLTPPVDLFDKITDADIVVIFAPDQRQLFRNLEFLRHSILTIEELYATEWYKYTRRDPEIVRRLRALVADIISGKKSGTFNPGIEDHVIEQIGAQGSSKLKIGISSVSPITSSGNLVGIIVVERGYPVED